MAAGGSGSWRASASSASAGEAARIEPGAAEAARETVAESLAAEIPPGDARTAGARAAHGRFVLTYVRPGPAGLMDGSVPTLAPIFATAFATRDRRTIPVVGLAASAGAGISTAFTEAVSDGGRIPGRAPPVQRGLAAGITRTLGGLCHAPTSLLPDSRSATAAAVPIVFLGAPGDRLDPERPHAEALPARGLPGGAGRRARLRRGNPDRHPLTGRRR
jgi:hypothetical protein